MEYSVDDFLEYIAEEARQKALLIIQIKKQEKLIEELKAQLKVSNIIPEEDEYRTSMKICEELSELVREEE